MPHPLYRFLLYGFPFFLLIAEAVIRFARNSHLSSTTFYIAICSATTMLLLVSAIPKEVAHRFQLELPTGCKIRSVIDERLVAISWLIQFFTILVWMYCLVIPEQATSFLISQFPDGRELSVPYPLTPEFIICNTLYMISVAIAEIKEHI